MCLSLKLQNDLTVTGAAASEIMTLYVKQKQMAWPETTCIKSYYKVYHMHWHINTWSDRKSNMA